MDKPKIFKVYCEYYVKADNIEDVEIYVSQEDDFYERHILVDEVEKSEIIDVDLT